MNSIYIILETNVFASVIKFFGRLISVSNRPILLTSLAGDRKYKMAVKLIMQQLIPSILHY